MDLHQALISKKFIKGGTSNVSLVRKAAYHYDASFSEIPPDRNIDFVPGACSSYVLDGKLYRNLDWDYSEQASFHIICSGFEGMAFLDGLTENHLDSSLIGQLPYHICDGVNDEGIMCAAHILYNDWDWHGVEGGIPLTKLPYLILTNVKSMATIETDLAEVIPDLCDTPALDAAEYLMQFIVTDGTTTYAILPPTNGQLYQIVDISENPKLTNFRWVEDEIVDREDLQERPTGVERWNMMPDDLEDLRFTLAYESPDRLSEFIGIDGTTSASTDEELEAIYDIAHALYLNRTRNGETWQTMYSAVYSQEGLESLYVQENYSRNYAPIHAPELEEKIVSITENGTTTITPTDGKDGMSEVEVTVAVSPDLEEKNVTVTQNGTTTITPAAGKDGMSEVELTVNVANPSTGKKIITDTNEVDVTDFATAQVVDNNLLPENIQLGISILGVNGTFSGSSTSYQEVIISQDRTNGGGILSEFAAFGIGSAVFWKKQFSAGNADAVAVIVNKAKNGIYVVSADMWGELTASGLITSAGAGAGWAYNIYQGDVWCYSAI